MSHVPQITHPSERTAVHAHEWPTALYVSWSDFVRCAPDDKVLVDSRTTGSAPESGSAAWLPPLEPHYVQNIGGGTLHIIAVEIKNS